MTTCAVIGHGVSPGGKGWGSRIDACDMVMRMWNWQFQFKHLDDYGERYDYGFYEISPTEMARFWKHVCIYPQETWVGCQISPPVKPYHGEFPTPSIMIDSVAWEREGMALGGMGTKGRLRLTRGVRAAAWVLERRLFKGDTMILVGFDNVHAGVGLPRDLAFPADYVTAPEAFPLRDYPTGRVKYEDYKGGVTKYGNHDYAVEGPLLKAIANRRSVELLHAQDVWQ